MLTGYWDGLWVTHILRTIDESLLRKVFLRNQYAGAFYYTHLGSCPGKLTIQLKERR
jgi:hypothetical protein